MINRIDKKFSTLKLRGEKALIPFVTAGDPDLKTTLEILRGLERSGADLIEVGVPFSDPMADGPSIQRSAARALRHGTSVADVLRLARIFRRSSEIPLILFGYYNPFLNYGLKRFAEDAKDSGVDGVLCVDLPPEESEEFRRWTRAEGLHNIFLLTPTSDQERIQRVAREARGFIYYVSVTGVTGARTGLESRLRAEVVRIRRYTSLPIGVGFGVSTPQQAASIASFADAVVVGSALIDAMASIKRKEDKLKRISRLIFALKQAMNGAG